MTTPVLKKIDVLRVKIDGLRPFDAHMLNQVREYFRIGMRLWSPSNTNLKGGKNRH